MEEKKLYVSYNHNGTLIAGPGPRKMVLEESRLYSEETGNSTTITQYVGNRKDLHDKYNQLSEKGAMFITSTQKTKDLTVTDKAEDDPVKEAKKEFESFCGMKFDHRKNSDCFTECQHDNPEQFARCVENFKTQPEPEKKKPAASSSRPASNTGRSGKNQYGHLINSQAELIDRVLLNADGPMVLDYIAEAANARKPRTRHHLLHLKNDWKVDVRLHKTGIFLGHLFPELVEDSKEYI